MSNHVEFLKSLIGRPWEANAKGPDSFDCWHLTRYVLQEHFHISVPEVLVPKEPTWPWMIETFRNHAELRRWSEVQSPVGGLLVVPSGSICLMARHSNPAHCGVLFRPEDKILHCSQTSGVVFQDPMELRMEGWAKLRYFVPNEHASV